MSKKPRNKKEFTEKDIEMLKSYGATALSQEKIAILLGFKSVEWFRTVLKKNDIARKALEEGRAATTYNCLKMLHDMGMKDRNFQALKFWLMTQEGLTVKHELAISGALELQAMTEDQGKEIRDKILKRLMSRKNGYSEPT